jgi:excisionase family DNA binding protein
MIDQTVFTPAEAAEYLRTSLTQLQRWRTQGGGPKFSKFGRRMVRYYRRHLDEWLRAQPAYTNTVEAEHGRKVS